jgi:hypothetical protein
VSSKCKARTTYPAAEGDPARAADPASEAYPVINFAVFFEAALALQRLGLLVDEGEDETFKGALGDAGEDALGKDVVAVAVFERQLQLCFSLNVK